MVGGVAHLHELIWGLLLASEKKGHFGVLCAACALSSYRAFATRMRSEYHYRKTILLLCITIAMSEEAKRGILNA